MEEPEILERLKALQKTINETQTLTLLAAKKVLNINDVALLTGLSKAQVYRLTCTHVLPFYKPNGKQIYFERDDVEAWMRSNRVASTAESESKASGYCATH